MNLGIIGSGYWGPKLIRNFAGLPNCSVKMVSDLKEGRLENIKNDFPFIETTLDYNKILNDTSITAVVIATPVTTHQKIAEEALSAGKHVFVEKPMTANAKEAELLYNSALQKNKKLAVGHVFQFAPAVRKMKELIESGYIGEVKHITSTRINLGPPATEVDVIWDLGPHDFSIILHLLGESPDRVSGFKNEYPFGVFNDPQNKNAQRLATNAHIHLDFSGEKSASIHLSWLSSNKVRLMQVFGTKGTLVYDEMLALDGKLRFYGLGVDNRIGNKAGDSAALGYSSGEILVIPLEQHEPLRLECQEFVDAVLQDKPLVNDGKIGMEVVKLLEASSK